MLDTSWSFFKSSKVRKHWTELETLEMTARQKWLTCGMDGLKNEWVCSNLNGFQEIEKEREKTKIKVDSNYSEWLWIFTVDIPWEDAEKIDCYQEERRMWAIIS